MHEYEVGGRRVILPKIPIRTILLVCAFVLFAILSTTSVYTVDPEEVGVVQRFGKYIGTTEPGLHGKLPFGIDQVTLVPVLRQEKEEFGFQTTKGGVQSEYKDYKQDPTLLKESLMVTGDLNMAMVEWIVQYRIKDPREYLFNVINPVDTLRYASESAMREVVGDHTVDEVLTVGREEISDDAQRKMQSIVNEYKMGITIERVVLQDVNPPEPVQASFNAVNQAQQERERLINEAHAQYNMVVPKATGEAAQTISVAKGYAINRVNEAKGDAAKFTAIFNEYLKAPDVTRRRIYLETMGDVIPKLGQKYILDQSSSGVLPLLQLNQTGVSTTPAKEAGK